jgi:hypothetical protein
MSTLRYLFTIYQGVKLADDIVQRILKGSLKIGIYVIKKNLPAFLV